MNSSLVLSGPKAWAAKRFMRHFKKENVRKVVIDEIHISSFTYLSMTDFEQLVRDKSLHHALDGL